MDLHPGLASLVRGSDQDVLSRWGRCCSISRGGVEHRLPFSTRGTGSIREHFGQGAWCNARVPLCPHPNVDLTVLGLELWPANHPLRRIEPEGPLLRTGRHDFVEQREVPTLVGSPLGIEMDLKKTLSARQIHAMPAHPVGADLTHRL